MQATNLFVIVENGKVINKPAPLPAHLEWEAPTVENKISRGYYPVFAIKPSSFSNALEVWESEEFQINSDHVVWTLTKRDKTQEELDAEKVEWWKGHRIERNFRLAETDWVIIKYLERDEAVPSEWLTYRQSLRDLTVNPDFDGNNYPTKPS